VTISPGNGSGAIADGATQDKPEDDANAGNVDLGEGFSPGADDKVAQAGPPADAFQKGAGGAGAGGAGGNGPGGLGGASTKPADPQSDEGKAQYAGLDGNGPGYSGGGGGGAYSRGGTGGNSKGSGIDLGGLLAKFLPQKDEAGSGGRNGILDYGKSRSPANDSLLDSKVNIFDRISVTYVEKVKSGRIGR
jgi:hypothetical protein